MKRKSLMLALAGTLAAIPFGALAEGFTPKQTEIMKQLVSLYFDKAKAEAAKSKDKSPVEPFSADHGRKLYLMARNWEGNEEPACSGCHTDDPKREGKHAMSKKTIRPLAPSVNPDRFTDIKKVEKNFATHCEEIYNRDCSAMEKGNFVTYMMSVK